MMQIARLLFVLLVCLQAGPAWSQEHHQQKPEDPFRILPLGQDVYALYGRGGNIGFFVGPESVFVVDSQFRDLAPGIVEKIRSVTDKPIKYLLNTHHHIDHTGGNEHFLKFAVILAHDNVRKHMLVSPQEILEEYPAALEDARKAGNDQRVKMIQEQIDWAKKVKVEEIPLPFLTYDSEFRIYLGGETIQVFHTPPAHTDGDSVAYFEKAKVVHLGDLGWNKVIPFIDVKGGGSPLGFIAALDRVIARIPADAKVIPGHGDVMDIDGIRTIRKYVQELLDTAAAAKKAGKSREDFVKEVELPEYKVWKGYDDRFKSSAGAAYDEQ